MPIRILTLCLLLIAASSFAIKSEENNLSQNLQYTFSNYTGSCISQTMVSLYLQTINDAYTFYSGDYSNNTNYIQSRLEGNYSADDFQVIILTENTTAGSWYLYSESGCSVVTWNGVNRAKPQWIYIIVKFFSYDLYPAAYVNYLSRGSGIDNNMHTVLLNVATNIEGAGTCTCRGLKEMSQKLSAFEGSKWNVVCSNYSSTSYVYARIKASGLKYDFFSPANISCQYLVWAF